MEEDWIHDWIFAFYKKNGSDASVLVLRAEWEMDGKGNWDIVEEWWEKIMKWTVKKV